MKSQVQEFSENRPVVSVCMITYGHENFIKEAIEGVLLQLVNFPIEFIIGDDCSPDRTFEIVQDFINNHPKGTLIKYKRHERNLGMMSNFIWSLKEAKGNFIALCDGDDYWTDPLKLQKQVDFLEKNPDYAIHFMNASVVDEHSNLISKKLTNLTRTTFSVQDFLMSDNPIATLTATFRNIPELKTEMLKKILDYPYGDWGVWVYVLYYSGLKAKFDDTVVASYRVHDGGVFSTKKAAETLRKIICVHELNLANFENLDRQQINSTITELKVKLLRELLVVNKKEAILLYLSNLSKIHKFFSIRDIFYALRKYK